MTHPRWRRFVGAVRRLRGHRDPRARLAVAALAVVGLAVGAILAARALPDGTDVTWWPVVVLAAAGGPWVLVLTTLEVRLTARIVGVHLTVPSAARTALIGTSANLLPVPGAAFVRLVALRDAGVKAARAGLAVTATGIGWVAVSLLAAGVALVPSPRAVPFLAAAAGAGAAFAVLLHRARPVSALPRIALRVVALESLFVATTAARFAICLYALDAGAGADRALVLALSTALAAAVGMFPSGLGLREAIATGLGPVASVPASVALVAAVLDRLAAFAGLAVLSVPVLFGWVRRDEARGRPAPGPGEETADARTAPAGGPA